MRNLLWPLFLFIVCKHTWFPQGIWNGCVSNKSFNLVYWDTVTKPKCFVGLGIRRARQTNIALSGKLVWKLLSGDGGLWGEVLKHKYIKDHRDGILLSTSNSSYIWQGIVKAWKNLEEGLVWKLGNGHFSFWHDQWTSLGKLCNLVPFACIISGRHVYANHKLPGQEKSISRPIIHTPYLT